MVQRSGACATGEGRAQELELVSMATMVEAYGAEADVGDQHQKPRGER